MRGGRGGGERQKAAKSRTVRKGAPLPLAARASARPQVAPRGRSALRDPAQPGACCPAAAAPALAAATALVPAPEVSEARWWRKAARRFGKMSHLQMRLRTGCIVRRRPQGLHAWKILVPVRDSTSTLVEWKGIVPEPHAIRQFDTGRMKEIIIAVIFFKKSCIGLQRNRHVKF